MMLQKKKNGGRNDNNKENEGTTIIVVLKVKTAITYLPYVIFPVSVWDKTSHFLYILSPLLPQFHTFFHDHSLRTANSLLLYTWSRCHVLISLHMERRRRKSRRNRRKRSNRSRKKRRYSDSDEREDRESDDSDSSGRKKKKRSSWV
ncbi:hypothetical protein AAZX31_11G147200 [Glycine max]